MQLKLRKALNLTRNKQELRSVRFKVLISERNHSNLKFVTFMQRTSKRPSTQNKIQIKIIIIVISISVKCVVKRVFRLIKSILTVSIKGRPALFLLNSSTTPAQVIAKTFPHLTYSVHILSLLPGTVDRRLNPLCSPNPIKMC